MTVPIPAKVALEITPEGWTWKVMDAAGETVLEHTMNMESRGRARGDGGTGGLYEKIEKLGWEGEPYWTELIEEIESPSDFGIAGVLFDIKADRYDMEETG